MTQEDETIWKLMTDNARLREALEACVTDCEFSLAPDVMALARAALEREEKP